MRWRWATRPCRHPADLPDRRQNSLSTATRMPTPAPIAPPSRTVRQCASLLISPTIFASVFSRSSAAPFSPCRRATSARRRADAPRRLSSRGPRRPPSPEGGAEAPRGSLTSDSTRESAVTEISRRRWLPNRGTEEFRRAFADWLRQMAERMPTPLRATNAAQIRSRLSVLSSTISCAAARLRALPAVSRHPSVAVAAPRSGPS